MTLAVRAGGLCDGLADAGDTLYLEIVTTGGVFEGLTDRGEDGGGAAVCDEPLDSLDECEGCDPTITTVAGVAPREATGGSGQGETELLFAIHATLPLCIPALVMLRGGMRRRIAGRLATLPHDA